jgi:hypothetical protein
VADPNQQPDIVGRIAFWLVGGLLYLSIALLPGVLMGWWYWNAGRTHLVTVPIIAVLCGALWAVSTFLGSDSHARHSG